jgi:SAM-dependent methyltransferase
MERARSFGGVAAEYQRGRPGYPPEAIAWLLGERPLEVVDLGAGTGKLTDALLRAGHSVTAVEPLAQMRAILAERLPEVTVCEGTAERTGLPDASADAILAGAAFHWFDRERAFPEIARILRPSPESVLGLLGNAIDRSRRWVAAFGEILGPARLGRPGHWPKQDELHRWFASVEDRCFPHEQLVDVGTLCDYAAVAQQRRDLARRRAPRAASADRVDVG